MFENFKNLHQLLDFFKDEKACTEYYEKARWKDGPVCPHCDCQKVYRTNRGYKCANRDCNKKFSVKIGTIFENSKISFRVWFAGIYLVTTSKKGISSLQFARQLGVTNKTAWFALHRIRQLWKGGGNAPILKGIVEADETFVGGKNKNRHWDKKVKNCQGRSSKDKIAVVGIMERDGGVKSFVVDNTDAETLFQIVDNNVSDDAIIVTDAYNSYNSLDEKYIHVSIKHKGGGFVKRDEDNEYHTQNIENYWSVFKRGYIGVYHYMSKQHLARYFSEFDYRRNTRSLTDRQRFDDTISCCAGKRLSYKKLIAHRLQRRA